MSPAAPPRDPIGHLVRSTDYLRRPSVPLPGLCAHKEWHHFLVDAPGLFLLVNMSVSEEPRLDGGGERSVGRLKVLVRGEGWDGDIEVFEADAIGAQAGRIDLAFGDDRVRFKDGRYRISLALRERDLRAELELTPRALPLLVEHVILVPGKPLSWVMVPRLSASGAVLWNGRRYPIDGAAAYHDHNWGYFRWGDDFTWEWATALPRDPVCPWSVAIVRTTDRARSRLVIQALYLWRGERLGRMFRGDELTFTCTGAARGAPILKVPRVMAMLEPGTAADVPRRIEVSARSGSAHVEVDIGVVDFAQILMPDEEGRRSVTILNQCFATLSLRGELDGERIEMEGSAVFEFIRG